MELAQLHPSVEPLSGLPPHQGVAGHRDLTYDDFWALDAGEWRLAYRETVMYGYPLSR